jgi:hypothetical protein
MATMGSPSDPRSDPDPDRDADLRYAPRTSPGGGLSDLVETLTFLFPGLLVVGAALWLLGEVVAVILLGALVFFLVGRFLLDWWG